MENEWKPNGIGRIEFKTRMRKRARERERERVEGKRKKDGKDDAGS